ncbi:MAG: hypothetical protein L6416_00480 [Candidatus Omnitrophica bacterium]|nr:hypothetical protein [Candidatus Omnitrophota bacterium]
MNFYESIGGEIKKFALPSMYNYLYSVSSLLNNRTYEDFKNWRISEYSKLQEPQLILNNENKQFLFEQLFFAYKLMNNVKFLSAQPETERVSFIQVGGMAFYYASYSLAACFIYCHSKNILGTHAKTYKNYSTVCEKLSFPFNVAGRYPNASFKGNEFQITKGQNEFGSQFQYDTQSLKRTNMSGFDYKSCVLSYLMGSHKFYWDHSQYYKEAMKELRRQELSNFRSNAGKAVREQKFNQMPEANYLSCLYRLRGKINYRDSLFSLYYLSDMGFNTYEKGTEIVRIMLEILKYFSLDVEAYLLHRLGGNNFYKNLLDDIMLSTRGYNFFFPEFQKNIFYPSP